MRSLFFFCFLAAVQADGQSKAIGLQVGSTLAGLKFRDANGIVTQLSPMPGLDAKVAFTQSLRGMQKVSWSMAIGYKSIQLRDRQTQVASRWSINAASYLATMNFSVVSKKRIRVNSGIGLESNLLFSAFQSRGFEQYVISDNIRKLNLSIAIDWAIEYQISNEAFCSIETSFFKGLTNLERDPSQTARLYGFTPSIAIHFMLNSNKRR